MRPVPRILPSERRPGSPGLTGVISAIGLPKRVTRTGFPVRRTDSSTARQVALNFEIAISSTSKPYHGPTPSFSGKPRDECLNADHVEAH